MSKANDAWIAIIEKLGGGVKSSSDSIVVSSQQIKSITKAIKGLGQQEPRLMTKFDSRNERPDVLIDLNYTILPIKNGVYNAIRGDGYHDIENAPPVETFTSQNPSLETLPATCSSESQVIDSAHAAGLLEHFFEEEKLLLTVRGRLWSNSFDFKFNGAPISVKRVQIEVDSGYEGKRIYLIEAKMGGRDDFITRQLYYPCRDWVGRVEGKEVVPVFITYSDQTYYIYEYKFADINEYSSIELVKSGAFIIEKGKTGDESVAGVPAELIDREYISRAVPAKSEDMSTPYPQANDFHKVIDYIDAVGAGISGKSNIAALYGFDVRQVDYYGNAAKYLGFLKRSEKDNSFAAAEKGVLFYKSNRAGRRKLLLDSLLESPSINEVMKMAAKDYDMLRPQEVQKVISKHRNDISGNTLPRRASTIIKWVRWAFGVIDGQAKG